MANEAFELLELLQKESPPHALQDLVHRARANGASKSELARISRAVDLSLGIHALFARRQQRETGLATLVDTARDLTLPYDVDALLKVITRRARLLLGLDMSWVSIDDHDAHRSRVRAADGHASALTVGFSVPLTGGVGRRATEGSAPFWSADYLTDDSFTHSEVIDDVVRAEGLHAVMAIPLQHQGSALGILYVADRRVRHFTPDEVSLMSSLVDLAAVAIEKARLLEETRHQVGALERNTSRAQDCSIAVHELSKTHGLLLDLVLRGSGLAALVTEAAQALDGTLLVRDAAGRVLSGPVGARPDNTGHTADQAPGPDERELTIASLEAHAKGRPVPCGDHGEHRWVAPLRAGDDALGCVEFACADPSDPADDRRLQLLALASQVITVALLMQDGAAAPQGQLRDEFFRGLLKGSLPPPEQVAEQARRLDIDLEAPHVVVVARVEKGSRGRATAWASSYAHRHHGLKHVEGDHVVVLLPGTEPGTAARAVSKELTEVLGGLVSVGSAGPARGPVEIACVHREARRCLDAVTRIKGPGGTASTDDLGFLGLLLSEQPDVDAFISSAIGPVLDYDDQQYTVLVPTLEAYFASASSPSRAAEVLHVHPNTVSRRLERITELLGEGWQKPSRALQVQLALQLQRTRVSLNRGLEQARQATG
ncbi:helix-turn-helix domain-containing protein [Streptomyces beihaiensis]|uniref:Helix-turn-helix domain-containing protein n=1 Tax=Streptomyces beihaiensis TaxID=2984495 RepID=A0ABT3TQG8_9ACTN|nr:GAF domain-containing protein [Streptomyces beihaiensis]MCX3059256.1 helix-turn-helix domain-containing protein [Streptomyces beihaiensis]